MNSYTHASHALGVKTHLHALPPSAAGFAGLDPKTGNNGNKAATVWPNDYGRVAVVAVVAGRFKGLNARMNFDRAIWPLGRMQTYARVKGPLGTGNNGNNGNTAVIANKYTSPYRQQTGNNWQQTSYKPLRGGM